MITNRCTSLWIALLAWLLLAGCISTKQAKNFHGTATPDGQPLLYQKTSLVSLALFGSYALVGDAGLENSVSEFAKASRASGAATITITHTDTSVLWYAYPPFSFIFTPVLTDVFGFVYGDAAKARGPSTDTVSVVRRGVASALKGAADLVDSRAEQKPQEQPESKSEPATKPATATERDNTGEPDTAGEPGKSTASDKTGQPGSTAEPAHRDRPKTARSTAHTGFRRPLAGKAGKQYRLDWCLRYGRDCGQPAARHFCRERGFADVVRFERERAVGSTLVPLDGRLCSGSICDGFRTITCRGKADAGS